MLGDEQCGGATLREVVIATPQLDDDVAAVREALGWSVAADEGVDAAIAARWAAPAAAGSRAVMLRPVASALAGMRFVAAHDTAGRAPPFVSAGWAAVELIVDRLDPLVERLRSWDGVVCAGLPRPIGDSGGVLRAAQFVLPGGAPLYLTEINGPFGAFDLPRSDPAAATVPPLAGGAFIAVLAASDLEASRRFLVDALGGRPVTDHGLPVGVLNAAFGLDPATRHRVSSVQLAGRTAIEIDQLPAGWRLRRHDPDALAPGVAVVEVEAGAGARLDGPLLGPDGVRLSCVRRAPGA